MAVLRNAIHAKDAGDKKDYGIDYELWLADAETIQTVAWDLAGSDTAIKSNEGINGTIAFLFIAGGAIGDSIKAKATMTTNHGRIAVETVTVNVA